MPSIYTNQIPAGTIHPLGGATVSGGYLLCDGTSKLKANYPALWGVIGYTYGGSGANFNVPDIRGLFIRGTGTNGTALLANGGAVSGATLGPTPQNDMIQGHYHSDGGHTHTIEGGTGSSFVGGPYTGAISANNTSWAGISTENVSVESPSNDGTNGPPRTGTETRPAHLTATYMIKY